MDERSLPLLCDPETYDALELNASALLNPKSGRRYPIRDGIPIFFEALPGSNKKYQERFQAMKKHVSRHGGVARHERDRSAVK